MFWLDACASMVTRIHTWLLWSCVKASALGPANREWEGKVLCNPHSVGLLPAGVQAGNPIAAPLSSLDTAGGTTSGQTVRPITGPLQLSRCLAISPLCSALLFSDVTYLFSLSLEDQIDDHDFCYKEIGCKQWLIFC